MYLHVEGNCQIGKLKLHEIELNSQGEDRKHDPTPGKRIAFQKRMRLAGKEQAEMLVGVNVQETREI